MAADENLKSLAQRFRSLQKLYPKDILYPYQFRTLTGRQERENQFTLILVPGVKNEIQKQELYVRNKIPQLVSKITEIVRQITRIKEIHVNAKKQLVALQKKNTTKQQSIGIPSKLYGKMIANPAYTSHSRYLTSTFENPYYKYSDPKYEGFPDNFIWPGAKGVLYKQVVQKLKTLGVNGFDILYSGTDTSSSKQRTYFIVIGCDGNLVWTGTSNKTGMLYAPGEMRDIEYWVKGSYATKMDDIIRQLGEKYK